MPAIPLAPAELELVSIELLPDPLVEPADDPVVPDVPEVLPVELPDVPYELPLDEPIDAFDRVHAPVEPCRHPVRVMVLEDRELLLWSQVDPDVPVVLPVWPLVVLPLCP